MTTDIAVVQQFRNTLDLPERDRGAAEAVAAGLRDAKAENTRRAYSSAWRQFRTWADAGGHPRTARRPAGRGPLPRPPGLNRPVHRHRPAGPLGHLPLSRRRRDAEGRQPGPPPGGVNGAEILGHWGGESVYPNWHEILLAAPSTWKCSLTPLSSQRPDTKTCGNITTTGIGLRLISQPSISFSKNPGTGTATSRTFSTVDTAAFGKDPQP